VLRRSFRPGVISQWQLFPLTCLALLVVAGPAAAQPVQDLRSPDAADAQLTQDLRSPDAADAAQPSTPSQVPAVHATDGGSGLDWATIALGLAGSLLILGGVVAVVVHGRRIGRARISA
jgi:hypothetical protein